MNKTAKIERLTASDGPVWTSQQGVPYYGIQLWMDNGDQGDALVKTPTELTVGQELTYQNETTQYGERIKIDWAAMRGGRPGGFRPASRGGNASFALSYAKDIAVARLSDSLSKGMTDDEIMTLAAKFKQWLDSNP